MEKVMREKKKRKKAGTHRSLADTGGKKTLSRSTINSYAWNA
jgi:hypothetical protein